MSRKHRLTSPLDFALIKSQGRAFRGAHCMVLASACPGEHTRLGFVASRKGVGNAVQRNRARRRMREIVRRRWPRVAATGHLLMFIAFRSTLTARHQDLASDIEGVLTAAGALARIESD
jgi:ribonuclease P protein component